MPLRGGRSSASLAAGPTPAGTKLIYTRTAPAPRNSARHRSVPVARVAALSAAVAPYQVIARPPAQAAASQAEYDHQQCCRNQQYLGVIEPMNIPELKHPARALPYGSPRIILLDVMRWWSALASARSRGSPSIAHTRSAARRANPPDTPTAKCPNAAVAWRASRQSPKQKQHGDRRGR